MCVTVDSPGAWMGLGWALWCWEQKQGCQAALGAPSEILGAPRSLLRVKGRRQSFASRIHREILQPSLCSDLPPPIF